jgi:chemotaxis protein MotB
MRTYHLILLATIVLITSCVPKRKLLSARKHVQNLQMDSTGTHRLLSDCNSVLAETKSKADKLEREKAGLKSDIQDLSSNSQTAIANSQMTIADQAKRLKDLQSMIQGQKDVLNNLKKTMADALVNFKPDELTVTLKDGKLYVSLQEKLLFKSGSAEVDPKGKEALKSLATVLNNTRDVNIMIEGHTDSIPIKGKYEDNWALSVSRAASIVRILTNSNAVDAHRIIASGRGEFYPVDDNKTSEGRSRNRRTEIILSPNLNELFKLLNQ